MNITQVAPGVALVESEEPVLVDGQSALDLLANANYQMEATGIAIDKALVAESFFVLSSGLAGEVLQKFTNYRMRIAIYGDFSKYTSKPLKDFIYESNKRGQVNFVATKEEAVAALAQG